MTDGRPSFPRFTAAEDAELRRLRHDGVTWARISEALGRSTSSCWRRMQKRGAPMPASVVWTAERDAYLRMAWPAGVAASAVVAALNAMPGRRLVVRAVRIRAHRMGLLGRQPASIPRLAA